MPKGQDRDRYAVGGGLVAGLSDNIAERLAGLDVAVPGQRRRASVAANRQAADDNTETTPMAAANAATKRKLASKAKRVRGWKGLRTMLPDIEITKRS